MESDQQERSAKRHVKLVPRQVQLCDLPYHPLRVQMYNLLKRLRRPHLQRPRGLHIQRKMFVAHSSLMFVRTTLGVRRARKTAQPVMASFYLIYHWHVPLGLECAVVTKNVAILLLASQVLTVEQRDSVCTIRRKRYQRSKAWLIRQWKRWRKRKHCWRVKETKLVRNNNIQ